MASPTVRWQKMDGRTWYGYAPRHRLFVSRISCAGYLCYSVVLTREPGYQHVHSFIHDGGAAGARAEAERALADRLKGGAS